MKLSGRDAAKWFERPNPDAPATLIYGQDAMRVALKRKVLIDALIGPNGAADMRLTRLLRGRRAQNPRRDCGRAKGRQLLPRPAGGVGGRGNRYRRRCDSGGVAGLGGGGRPSGCDLWCADATVKTAQTV